MCTVSWVHEDQGYHLFCNRDERRTRGKAAPPRVAVRDGVQYIAPVDADFGGTWLAANEFGISVCLLNGGAGAAPARSRGLLVLDLMHLASGAKIGQHLSTLDLSMYAPFTLAALEPGEPVVIVEWNGSRKTIRHEAGRSFMLTSSSFDAAVVQSRRREEYRRTQATPEEFGRFHASHANGPSAYSICMHRPDAETVSFSRIRVSGTQTEFEYSPAAPCQASPAETTRLRLARTIVRSSAAVRRDA